MFLLYELKEVICAIAWPALRPILWLKDQPCDLTLRLVVKLVVTFVRSDSELMHVHVYKVRSQTQHNKGLVFNHENICVSHAVFKIYDQIVLDSSLKKAT